MVLKDKYIIIGHKIYIVNQLIKNNTEYALYTYLVTNIFGDFDRNRTIVHRVDGLSIHKIKANAMDWHDLKKYPHYFI